MTDDRQLAVAAIGAPTLVAGVARAEDADQRRGRDVPVPDLLEVVLPSTTSCTRTSRSTTSRSDRARGIRQLTTRRSSSAPPTAR